MSKAWCEKNRATKPQNYTQKEDMITARQANGTGPVHAEGARARREDGARRRTRTGGASRTAASRATPTRSIYTPIVSDATRVAALISGEVDLVNDPPPQDVPRLAQTPGHQGARRHREPHRVHRHGPGARRAPVLERQGQEPVQGQARAPGALPGDRHRGDQEEHDARAVAAVGRDAAVAAADDARDREAAAVRQASARRSCSPRPATRTASR